MIPIAEHPQPLEIAALRINLFVRILATGRAKVSGILLACPTLHMNVEGQTDTIGTDEYNLGLSKRRADAVHDYLTSNGISAANVQSIGLGKADPVASNDTAPGRQQNRRVEMVVSRDFIGQPIHPATSSLR